MVCYDDSMLLVSNKFEQIFIRLVLLSLAGQYEPVNLGTWVLCVNLWLTICNYCSQIKFFSFTPTVPTICYTTTILFKVILWNSCHISSEIKQGMYYIHWYQFFVVFGIKEVISKYSRLERIQLWFYIYVDIEKYPQYINIYVYINQNYINMCMCSCVCVCINMHIYIYIYIYICIFNHGSWLITPSPSQGIETRIKISNLLSHKAILWLVWEYGLRLSFQRILAPYSEVRDATERGQEDCE
jgi:hypothetical protein